MTLPIVRWPGRCGHCHQETTVTVYPYSCMYPVTTDAEDFYRWEVCDKPACRQWWDNK